MLGLGLPALQETKATPYWTFGFQDRAGSLVGGRADERGKVPLARIIKANSRTWKKA